VEAEVSSSPARRATALARRGLAIACGALLAALAVAAPAEAERPFDFGFADDRFADNLFTSSNAEVRNEWFGRAESVNSRYARINVYWSVVTGDSEPANPRDPADPAYDWTEIDNAVTSAAAHDQEVILLTLNAPTWAQGANRPTDGSIRSGTWKPDPAKLEDFAVALATRYSGTYADPDDPDCGLPICPVAGPVLPRVDYYEAWNEPNLDNYLEPLWNGKKPVAPDLYRPMLNAVYDGVKSVNPQSKVITGGTSPFGSSPGGDKIWPQYFWREVFCLSPKLKKNPGCTGDEQPRFDIFGHNAINAPGDKPQVEGLHPDDATPSDMGEMRKLLRAAEKANTVGGPGRHAIWSTETWYESNPPEKTKNKALSLKAHAQAMADAMYILWKSGAENVIWLQLRDSPYDPNGPALVGFQSGIYFLNEKPKPAVRMLRFPLVADRKGNKPKAVFWGIAPGNGKLQIQVKSKGGGFKTVARKKIGAGEVFALKGKLKGHKPKVRAKQAGKKSLTVKPG
jgi:hypothetical protein